MSRGSRPEKLRGVSRSGGPPIHTTQPQANRPTDLGATCTHLIVHKHPPCTHSSPLGIFSSLPQIPGTCIRIAHILAHTCIHTTGTHTHFFVYTPPVGHTHIYVSMLVHVKTAKLLVLEEIEERQQDKLILQTHFTDTAATYWPFLASAALFSHPPTPTPPPPPPRTITG